MVDYFIKSEVTFYSDPVLEKQGTNTHYDVYQVISDVDTAASKKLGVFFGLSVFFLICLIIFPFYLTTSGFYKISGFSFLVCVLILTFLLIGCIVCTLFSLSLLADERMFFVSRFKTLKGAKNYIAYLKENDILPLAKAGGFRQHGR